MSTGYEPYGTVEADRGQDVPPGPPPEARASLRTWARDLTLGARFAAGGGREGWTRTVLTAIGVGLGVALLLLAAAVPAMMDAREQRQVARDTASNVFVAEPTAHSVLLADQNTVFRGEDITGRLIQREGDQAAKPPGIDRVPAPGQMVVSPALRHLLASEPLLRDRLPYTITGTIGHAGLTGPAELYYYAGSDRLVARDADYRHGNAERITSFGYHSSSEAMGPTFDLLLVIMLVVLLLPVAVFIGTAVRLGGERRDRRLAALRLVGADIRMTHRIAAGEALLGALFGLLLGGGFFLLGRQLASKVSIRDISAFPSDMTPSTALTLLIVVAVPLASVAVTLVSLRGTAIEPLGVVRQAVGRRRRLWWRLLVPVIGLGLLAPLFGTVKGGTSINQYQIATGAVLLLIGVTAVLPWAVESVVSRLSGGPIPWQLAIRRLQLNSSSSARMVSGVTVAVAGAIALQMLFTGVNSDFVYDTGADTARAQASVGAPVTDGRQTAAYTEKIRATRGVTHVFGNTEASATQPDASTRRTTDNDAYLPIQVGDCASLREMARITSCSPGSVFIVSPQDGMGDDEAMGKYARPGARIDLNTPDSDKYTGKPRYWTIPASARAVVTRADPTGSHQWGIFSTPEALDAGLLKSATAHITVGVDPKVPDAIEYVRNTVAGMGTDVYVYALHDTKEKTGYRQLRRGLFAGAALTMGLIGASLLVTMLEQLRERKKLLAVLVAFGTRRTALAWSVLWQTAIPVVLGLLLACGGGIGLGAALLAMVDRPIRTDWSSVLTMTSIGAAVVFAVTLLSLPPLWRLMRADGLRTE
ncbi:MULTISPECIES: FtsX-like permease family protein [unclassified Streptomyces]|uniref:FtsX-like permease family protein n=1 Tax=unclassified Streptomyces TaxID=2593676 RepID=UPI002E2A5F0F|nr:FtsX-like permease family protein [Streptomyces sp. NBC_00223]